MCPLRLALYVAQRARKLCEKKLGPLHDSTLKVSFILNSIRDVDGALRRPADRNLHFISFNAMSKVGYQNYLDLAKIIRRRAFVEELGVSPDEESDSMDNNSNHLLGLYGDAPVSYARWRMDESQALIDRLCTLRGYRYRGVARSCFETVIKEASAQITASNKTLSGLTLLVPHTQTLLKQKLVQSNFVPMDGSPTDLCNYIRMHLAVQPGTF